MTDLIVTPAPLRVGDRVTYHGKPGCVYYVNAHTGYVAVELDAGGFRLIGREHNFKRS